MNKIKKANTELDHIRDTLTDLVGSVGEAHSDIKNLEQKLDNYQQETHKRFDQQDKRFDQLEILIRQLLPSSSH